MNMTEKNEPEESSILDIIEELIITTDEEVSKNDVPIPNENPFNFSLENVQTDSNNENTNANVFGYETDRHFLPWLNSINSSIFVSSYKSNQFMSFGVYKNNPTQDPALKVYLTNFMRPLGFYIDKEVAWIATATMLWKYVNIGQSEELGVERLNFDGTYVPRKIYTTNDIDTHDVTIDNKGEPHFCSASFSCICTPSDKYSFDVFWKPPWITKVAQEDRCHLNGLCNLNGKPRFVTCVRMSDDRHGWNEHNRIESGVVYDIVAKKVICSGLTMPHSPRIYMNKLWVLNSGSGEFGFVNSENNFIAKVFIPGFLRGLCFIGKYAIVGSSSDRHEKTFQNLPLGKSLKEKNLKPQCGFYVVDLETFNIAHSVKFNETVKEIYDVQIVEGVKRPKFMDINSTEIQTNFYLEN